MIKEIELRNWKTHSDTKLTFQKGVNVLIGIMGAGKSSVMEGISFGLFGTFPALKQRRIKLEDLIKSRPAKEKEAEVRLTFAVGNDTYTVTRTLSTAGSTTAKLEKNGAYLQAQPARVSEEIESLLKVDYDTFARAVYSEQNGLEYFLSIPKGDRKKQIDNMLGLDQFATAEENSTSLINSIRSVISGEETALGSMDVGSMRKQLEKLSSEKDKLTKELGELKSKESSERAATKAIEQKIEAQRKEYNKKEELSRQIVELKGKISVLESEAAKIEAGVKGAEEEPLKKALEEGTRRESDLKKNIAEGESKVKALTKEVSEFQAALNNDQKRTKDRNLLLQQMKGKNIDEIGKNLEGTVKLINEAVNQGALGKTKMEELDSSIKELQKHLAKCPVCERELDQEMSDKLISSKRAIADSMKMEVEKAEKALEVGRRHLQELEEERSSVLLANNRIKDYDGIDESIKRNGALLEERSKEQKASSEALEARRAELDKLKDTINSAKSVLDMFRKRNEHQSEIKALSARLASAEKEHASMKISQAEIAESQTKFAKQSESLGSIVATISEAGKRASSLDSGIIDLVKQIDGIKEMEQRLQSRRNVVKNLNSFKSALIETETLLRARLLHSINALMQGVWPELYPYQDYQKLRLDAGSDDYTLQTSLVTNGADEWAPVDAIASGGERSIACLALRISLSMVVVPNLKWLILDEPTHNIDSTGISKLIEVLGDSLPKVVDQVFIVTHDENLKQISSARVYQLDRDKASAGSTSALEL